MKTAIPRHLVFVLEDGRIVVQRTANEAKSLLSNERITFMDDERDHSVTDAELVALREKGAVEDFDEHTIWLPRLTTGILSLGQVRYYVISTTLSAPYLPIISHQLQSAGLSHRYIARERMGMVKMMGQNGEPFASLTDAQNALTLLQQVIPANFTSLAIEKMHIHMDGEMPQEEEANPAKLIKETPLSTLADYSVLIISHEAETASHLESLMKTLGVKVKMADDGESGVQIAIDEEPDIILLEVHLPDLHAYEVMLRLRRDPFNAHTPIILLSGLGSEQDVLFAQLVARAEDYFIKPVSANLLRQRVLTLFMNRQG